MGIDKIPYPACSGRVQYRDFLRVLRLKACPLSQKVSYQIAQDFLNIVGLNFKAIQNLIIIYALSFMLNS